MTEEQNKFFALHPIHFKSYFFPKPIKSSVFIFSSENIAQIFGVQDRVFSTGCDVEDHWSVPVFI